MYKKEFRQYMCAPTWVNSTTKRYMNPGRSRKRLNTFWVIGVSLWRQVPNMLKMVYNRKHTPPSVHASKNTLTGHQVVLDHNIILQDATLRSEFIYKLFATHGKKNGDAWIKRNFTCNTHYTKSPTCKVRTTYSQKQAHLFGIILETIWLILIGNTCHKAW